MPLLIALLLVVVACACLIGGVWLLFGLGWVMIAAAPCLVFLAMIVARGANG